MAKAELNPLFTNYRGRLGNIVFYEINGSLYSRERAKQSNPDTEAQRYNRRTFSEAVKSWQALLPEEKSEYNKRGKKKRQRGYNLFISEYMKANTVRGNNTGCRDTACCVSAAGMPLRSSSVSTPLVPAFSSCTAPVVPVCRRE